MAELDERENKLQFERFRRTAKKERAEKSKNEPKQPLKTRAKASISSKAKSLHAKAGKKLRSVVPPSTWLLIIALAGMKDLLDLVSLDLLSWLDWVIDLALGFLLFLVSGSGTAARMRNLQRTIVTTVLEVIPFLGLFPIWTISVFLLKQKEENKSQEEK